MRDLGLPVIEAVGSLFEPLLPDGTLPSEAEEPLAVTITADGTVTIQTTEVPMDQLVNRLRAIAVERADDRIFLRADGAVPYQMVAQVMGALNRGGFSSIGLVTDSGGPAMDDGADGG